MTPEDLIDFYKRSAATELDVPRLLRRPDAGGATRELHAALALTSELTEAFICYVDHEHPELAQDERP